MAIAIEVGHRIVSSHHLGRRLAIVGAALFVTGFAGDFYLESIIEKEVKGQIPDTVSPVDQETATNAMEKWLAEVNDSTMNPHRSSYAKVIRLASDLETRKADALLQQVYAVEDQRQPLIDAQKTEWGYGPGVHNRPFGYTKSFQLLGVLGMFGGWVVGVRSRFFKKEN